MWGLTEEQMRAAEQRVIESRRAAGLPRYVEDGPTLDRIARIVVASQRARARQAAGDPLWRPRRKRAQT